MNPLKVQAAIPEQSKKCIDELERQESDFVSAVSSFLTSSHKNCLLVETKDSKLGALRIMQILKQLEGDLENRKISGRYLGTEHQTFLYWKQLLDLIGMAEDLPRFTNLLVCIFPDDDVMKLENIEKQVFHKISDRINIAVLKKEINTKALLKIDEIRNKETSLIYDDKKALLEKVSCGDIDGVEELLKNGIDVNFTFGQDEFTALNVAAKNGHKDMVLTLLRHGADILPDKSGNTPLNTAALNGHTSIVSALLENEVDVDIRGEGGQTALFMAVAKGHRDVIKTLLKYNSNVNAETRFKDTALHHAAKNGDKDIVLLLLENGADVDIKNEPGRTALHYATVKNHTDVVKTLLEHGAAVEAECDSGQTPLHVAASSSRIEVVNTFLNYGADINAKGRWQYTPLHYAASNGHFDTVKVLIEKGANVHDKNQYGETALDIVLQKGDSRIVSLLSIIL